MADSRKQYTVVLGGVEHTMLLTPEDAASYGARAVESKAVPAPANKARQVQNK